MDNDYNDKLDEYMSNMNNHMFIFEITKCCGYSTFVAVYKNETLIDLYSRIMSHFDKMEIKKLYFYSPNSDEHIKVPLSKMILSQFVKNNITCNPVKLSPIYPVPNPIVYRLYLDDGCSHTNCINNSK